MIEMIIFNITAILEIKKYNCKRWEFKIEKFRCIYCNLLELRLNVKNQITTKKRAKIKKLYKLFILIGNISIQYHQKFEIIFLFRFLLCILAYLHQMHLFLFFLERREIWFLHPFGERNNGKASGIPVYLT